MCGAGVGHGTLISGESRVSTGVVGLGW